MNDKTRINGAEGDLPKYTQLGDSRRARDRLPPEFETWEKVFYRAADFVFLVTLVLVAWICLTGFQVSKFLPDCDCWPYIIFGAMLVSLFVDRYFRNRQHLHDARLEDRSEIESMFVEVKSVEFRVLNPKRPLNFKEKKEALLAEMKRLKNLGPESWTEFQTLPLSQMLVDFMKVDELIAQSRSNLSVFEEYMEDNPFRSDVEIYVRTLDRIEAAIERIGEPEELTPQKRDSKSEQLRAELKTLLADIADYQANWAEGTTAIRNLMTCGTVAVPVLLVMGILPIFSGTNNSLSILHWGLIGASGAVTAVLLYLYQSNRLEVGNTEGKVQFWRTVLGTILGFVSGVLVYTIIAGGLVTKGIAIPQFESTVVEGVVFSKNVYLSILWAFVAGFLFEGVFNRVRQVLKPS